MIFNSKYSKLDLGERIELFKKINSVDVRSYVKKSDLTKYHEDDLGQQTPLNLAVKYANISVVLELVKMGANAFFAVNKYSNPAICDAIGSNRPLSDIKLIAQHSKHKVDWNTESIGKYSCQIAAAGRSDKRMLEFLHEQGVDLTKIHRSELATFNSISTAILDGPLENVEFLHSVGCTYPESVRGLFHLAFSSMGGRDHKEPWRVVSTVGSDLDLTSERVKKFKFLLEKRIIEPHFFRQQMIDAKISLEFQKRFWLNTDIAIARYEVRAIVNDVYRELVEIDGVKVEIVEQLRDKKLGHVYGKVLKVTHQWLLDLHAETVKYVPPSIPKIFPSQKSSKTKSDDEYYEYALREVENNLQISSTWAKAMTLCKGDSAAAKWKYIELRVIALRNQA